MPDSNIQFVTTVMSCFIVNRVILSQLHLILPILVIYILIMHLCQDISMLLIKYSTTQHLSILLQAATMCQLVCGEGASCEPAMVLLVASNNHGCHLYSN